LGGARLKRLVLARSPTRLIRTGVLGFEFNRGEVFISFCYHAGATDLLTPDVVDPFGKIPEFKNCAESIDAG